MNTTVQKEMRIMWKSGPGASRASPFCFKVPCNRLFTRELAARQQKRLTRDRCFAMIWVRGNQHGSFSVAVATPRRVSADEHVIVSRFTPKNLINSWSKRCIEGNGCSDTPSDLFLGPVDRALCVPKALS